jgi:hypothetical protein
MENVGQICHGSIKLALRQLTCLRAATASSRVALARNLWMLLNAKIWGKPAGPSLVRIVALHRKMQSTRHFGTMSGHLHLTRVCVHYYSRGQTTVFRFTHLDLLLPLRDLVGKSVLQALHMNQLVKVGRELVCHM